MRTWDSVDGMLFLSCLASGHMKTAMEHATEEFDDLAIGIAEFQYRKD